jgi:hypothetical protein
MVLHTAEAGMVLQVKPAAPTWAALTAIARR